MARKSHIHSKIFVLDTNVLMHDPTSLFRFEEHDIYLPMITLEELDNNKKGMTEVARNARQASRFLDEIVTGAQTAMEDGFPLSITRSQAVSGRLFLQTKPMNGELPAGMPTGKADNQIIGVVMHLQQQHPKREVILVSKDINMRIKARALGYAAEDYFNDKVLEDTDLLYTGTQGTAAGFLGQPRQGHGILAGSRPHLLPHQGPAVLQPADQRIRLSGSTTTRSTPSSGK